MITRLRSSSAVTFAVPVQPRLTGKSIELAHSLCGALAALRLRAVALDHTVEHRYTERFNQQLLDISWGMPPVHGAGQVVNQTRGRPSGCYAKSGRAVRASSLTRVCQLSRPLILPTAEGVSPCCQLERSVAATSRFRPRLSLTSQLSVAVSGVSRRWVNV